jgi:exopolyphosphatase / guanosine-5'-triphosphate,3'-diphosphate pyrophosphatase
VVEANGRDWRSLYQAQRVTRLGEGQSRAGRLLDGPMRRTVDTVAEFIAVALRLGALDVHVVATSAVRTAPNRDDFVARVRAATGHGVRVVSGEDEARLTLAGAVAGLPDLGGSFTLVDIGGGSTELVVARDGRPVRTVSLSLGVVPLGERFTDAGPVAPDSFARMRREAERCLTQDLPPEIATAAAPALVGTAGTMTTLAALDLGLRAYDADRVQAHALHRAAVEGWLARLAPLTLEERAGIPCIEPGRADVLVPGIAICLAIMDRLGHDSVVVSDRGLREGIVCGLLSAL